MRLVQQSPTLEPHCPNERRDFVTKTLRLMYLTEFIVLIEFTEAIMPVIYSVYVAVLSMGPNRNYYRFLHGMSSEAFASMLVNVSLYVSMEILSFVLVALVLWWHLRFSLVHQLAFVLHTRQPNIQSKVLPWVVYVVQNALLHSGADYTFHFIWLRSNATT